MSNSVYKNGLGQHRMAAMRVSESASVRRPEVDRCCRRRRFDQPAFHPSMAGEPVWTAVDPSRNAQLVYFARPSGRHASSTSIAQFLSLFLPLSSVPSVSASIPASVGPVRKFSALELVVPQLSSINMSHDRFKEREKEREGGIEGERGREREMSTGNSEKSPDVPDRDKSGLDSRRSLIFNFLSNLCIFLLSCLQVIAYTGCSISIGMILFNCSFSPI